MKVTEAQIHFIECLAIDLGLDRRARQLTIEAILERSSIRFIDEITRAEASQVIEYFKALKEGD